jgi:hypothetical protein
MTVVVSKFFETVVVEIPRVRKYTNTIDNFTATVECRMAREI